jgi:hypothetical protein
MSVLLVVKKEVSRTKRGLADKKRSHGQKEASRTKMSVRPQKFNNIFF